MAIPWHVDPFRHLSLVLGTMINNVNIIVDKWKETRHSKKRELIPDFIYCVHPVQMHEYKSKE